MQIHIHRYGSVGDMMFDEQETDGEQNCFSNVFWNFMQGVGYEPTNPYGTGS